MALLPPTPMPVSSFPTHHEVIPPESSPTRHLQGTDVFERLKAQLQFYFSPNNLASDAYLLSQMNAQKYVPIDVIANFRKVRSLTEDRQLLVNVMKECTNLVLDPTETMVRPNIKVERNTLILRDIPQSTPVEEVKAIFDGKYSSKIIDIHPDVGDTWFVTFETQDIAMDTCLDLTSKTFQGKQIRCRVKSENVFRSFSNASTTYYVSPMDNMSMGTSSHSLPQQYPVPIQSHPHPHVHSHPSHVPMDRGGYLSAGHYAPDPYYEPQYAMGPQYTMEPQYTIGPSYNPYQQSMMPSPYSQMNQYQYLPKNPSMNPPMPTHNQSHFNTRMYGEHPKHERRSRRPGRPRKGSHHPKSRKKQSNYRNRQSQNSRHHDHHHHHHPFAHGSGKGGRPKQQNQPPQPQLGLEHFPALPTKKPSAGYNKPFQKYAREAMADLIKKLANKGFVKPHGIPDNPAVIRKTPATDSQLMEPMPVMYPASPSPILAARVHHSSDVPFLDLSTNMGPYLPADPLIKGSITGHMNIPPIATTSDPVEVGVADDLPSVSEIKKSRVETNTSNIQPPPTQQQPNIQLDTTNKIEAISSLSSTKYANKGGPRIGQKKGARQKPGSKKEKLVQNKSKYSGSSIYAQRSVQKAKGIEKKREVQNCQRGEVGGLDTLKVNEKSSKGMNVQSKPKCKTTAPKHTKHHKIEQDPKAPKRLHTGMSFADVLMARRIANTKIN